MRPQMLVKEVMTLMRNRDSSFNRGQIPAAETISNKSRMRFAITTDFHQKPAHLVVPKGLRLKLSSVGKSQR
jgi:hypothetical protein